MYTLAAGCSHYTASRGYAVTERRLLRGLRRRQRIKQTSPALPRETGLWMVAAAAITVAPHALHLPAWITALCGLLLVWRAFGLLRGHAAISPWLLLPLAAAAGTAVRAQFGHFFGQEPGVALLALLLCLKLFELRSVRDIRAAVLLCFFLQLGLFFDDETLPIAALALFGTVVAIGCLLALEDSRAGTRARLRQAAVLLAQSLPLMVVLFLLFPRISAPLWGLPADAHSASSGLSETMSPGSISALGLSEEIAFRVEFPGAAPEPRLRYWRGPVLTEFDGRTWKPLPRGANDRPAYSTSGARIDYRMTLEPHGQRWLLALDFAAADLRGVRYTLDYQALNPVPVRNRIQLDLAAYPATRVGTEERRTVLDAALRLPAGNPRSRALATRLTEGTSSAHQVVQRTLDHLRAGGYRYTLEPPLLGQQVIDEFLFDSRQGFCEHFSAAFVFLMRASGVPARVVAGYQGGELNPFDGTLIVRQSDAHAWAEVWLPGEGWVRVDPTAEVAPLRISGERQAAARSGDALPLMMQPRLDWLRQLRLRWEAASHAWDLWVLGYNSERQNALLRELGLQSSWLALSGLISLAGVTVFALLFLWAQLRQTRSDALDRAWSAFCAKLARAGLPRHDWEGPLDYGRRVAHARPTQARQLAHIADTYARLRYGSRPADQDIRSLARDIASLKLK